MYHLNIRGKTHMKIQSSVSLDELTIFLDNVIFTSNLMKESAE